MRATSVIVQFTGKGKYRGESCKNKRRYVAVPPRR